MIRDLPRLGDQEFDVLVVGGGIYGLTIAYDAAQRGLSVALIDRGDFGAATSFNHLKTIHGGLRYLQSADIRRMRESIVERRAFARIAPRWVVPLAFTIPTDASLTRNPMAMRAALAIDAFMARDRNAGVDPSRHLPAGRVIAGVQCRELFEGAIRTVASAAVWHDYQTVDGDRITLAFALAAVAHGAVLANYVEATGPLKDRSRLAGVTARDVLTGDAFDIRARMLVNAGGPWGATLFDRTTARTSWPLLKAMNLITSRPARKAALVGATPAGRALVLLPWNGRTLVGTSESADTRQPDDQDARRTEVDAFLAEINATFPALGLKAEEVTLVHRGIVPAATVNDRLSLLGQSRIIDHGKGGQLPELISIVGVKYTTARIVAERAVDLLLTKLGRAPVACRTAVTLLPGAGLEEPERGDQILHAVREEMAHTLTDVVVRRTGLGAAGKPTESVMNDVAVRMQELLRWSDQRKADELDTLKRFYDIAG
ncbi:MAG TPA: FAD-dependent oxidoreductase [Vicinamibacterales bacterium]|nr:FAD-dependent oxidoreductase [Vicinamibacterales bacterium]